MRKGALLWVFPALTPPSLLRRPPLSSPPAAGWGRTREWWAWDGALSVWPGLHYDWRGRQRWALSNLEILPLSILIWIGFAASARKCLFLCQNWVKNMIHIDRADVLEGVDSTKEQNLSSKSYCLCACSLRGQVRQFGPCFTLKRKHFALG